MYQYLGCFNKNEIVPEIMSLSPNDPTSFTVDCIFFKKCDNNTVEYLCVFLNAAESKSLYVSCHDKRGNLIASNKPICYHIQMLELIPTIDMAEAVYATNEVAIWLRDKEWFNRRKYGNIDSWSSHCIA